MNRVEIECGKEDYTTSIAYHKGALKVIHEIKTHQNFTTTSAILSSKSQ